MKPGDPLKFRQLHEDRSSRTRPKWSTSALYEELLVFLEGEGLRNQNSGLIMSQLLDKPPDDFIEIEFNGLNYRVTRISYPLNQQFARFHLISVG